MLLKLEDIQYTMLQEVSRPKIEYHLGKIEYLWEDLLVWAEGEAVTLPEPKKTRRRKRKGNSKVVEEPKDDNCVIVMWDEQYLGKDENGKVEGNPQLMTLLKTKYYKHVETDWGCILSND